MNNVLEHKNGLVGTILLHAALVLLLIFFGFRTPLPLPPEQGLLVNFGNSETGFGELEPQDNTPASNAIAPAEESREETNLTQDFEDAPAIEEKKVVEKVEKKTPDKKVVVQKKNETVPVEEVKKVNTKALYTGKTPDGGAGNSQGVAGGEGNQGVENGSENAPNYGPGGGAGNGAPSFSLAGRSSLKLPQPEYHSKEQGKVVVDITVDKEGNVVSAQPGGKGTTTSDPSLWEAARKAAFSAKFDRKPDAPATQKGNITYVFLLE
ncbi:MAG: energy transducer TonB [Bacteroidales bacterium]